MDDQGTGWTRSAADTRRPASWPRPQGLQGSTAPGDSADTAPQPVLSPLGRTPARGFPPGREPAATPPGGFGSWSTPRDPNPAAPAAPVGPAASAGPAGPVGPAALDDDQEYALDGGHGPYGMEHGTDAADHPDPIVRVDPEPAAAFAVPAGGGSGRRRAAKARPKGLLAGRPALLATAAVVAVAAIGFGGYKFFYEPRINAPVSSALRLPTSAPVSSDFNQSLGKWQHIGTRTQDPDPLTVEGLFPPQFVLDGSSYVRTAASVTKNCTQEVYGAQLQTALKSGHCTQVARATYLSGNGQMMGTVGVLNLTSTAAASKAGQVTGPDQIIAPLSAKTGPTKKLGNGTGVVQAEVKGHYLILMWAEFADLKSPSSTAAKQQLEQFAANLVTGSANINLSTRMLSGKS